jgi:hypothetical protein
LRNTLKEYGRKREIYNGKETKQNATDQPRKEKQKDGNK